MAIVVFKSTKRIGENGDRLVERDAVLGEIRSRLPGIPLERQRHGPNLVSELGIHLTELRSAAAHQ